jgi:hypothetical protein
LFVVNNAVVREIVRCSLSVFRSAIRGNLSPTYLLADLKQFGKEIPRELAHHLTAFVTGLADEKATLVAQMWKSSLANIKRTAAGNTLSVNQLVDLEWKFGVTAANTDLSKVKIDSSSAFTCFCASGWRLLLAVQTIFGRWRQSNTQSADGADTAAVLLSFQRTRESTCTDFIIKAITHAVYFGDARLDADADAAANIDCDSGDPAPVAAAAECKSALLARSSQSDQMQMMAV